MRQRTMFVYVTSGAWYWGFRCRQCQALVAIEEATRAQPTLGPNVSIAASCRNGHPGTWLVKEAVKIKAA